MQNHRFTFALFFLMSLLAGSAAAGTLGVTVIGSQTGSWAADYAHGNTHTATSGFVATSVEVYFINSGNNTTLKAAVYATASGTPTTLLSDTSTVLATADGWYSLLLATPVAISPNVTYFICVAGDQIHGCKYEPAVASSTYYESISALTFSSTFSPTFYAQAPQSMYLTGPDFTPTITPTGTITPTSTITPTETITPTLVPTRTVTPTGTATLVVTPTITPTWTASATAVQDMKNITAFPSPAKGDTIKFAFYLDTPGTATIEIFNMVGEKIATVNETCGSAGRQCLTWKCAQTAPGIYLYRLRTQNQTSPFKKLVILEH